MLKAGFTFSDALVTNIEVLGLGDDEDEDDWDDDEDEEDEEDFGD
jgi:hypothetical protein